MNSFDASLKEYTNKVMERANYFIGYPIAQDFDYSELYPLLKYPLNNIGDPYIESTYDLNSRSIEQKVVQFFADLFHAAPDNRWGYVTNGGSEGNLYGLYVAKELYPNGMVYFSEATHYSVQKNIHLLNMESITICSTKNGEMDYEDLKEAVQLHRHRPAIILANIGTTMTEAKDDIQKIRAVLKASAIKNFYVHCDAALAGIYLSLLNKEPPFDFRFGADSIAISGHKFIGSPIPCGVVIVKKSYKERVGKTIPYIGTMDTTITGSRNGHSPLFLWYAINKLGVDGLRRRAKESLVLAQYAEQKLNGIGCKAWRNDHALTIVFPQPSEQLRIKWQLASEGGWSHIVCMPGVSREQVDLFVHDLDQDLALKKELVSEDFIQTN